MWTSKRKGKKCVRRSGLEDRIEAQLQARGVAYEYEPERIPYTDPRTHHYLFDFRLPNGTIVEAKGLFESADRTKHKLVKDQHPELDIRFVFSNPHARLSKTSRTTYAEWCDKHGFKWAAKTIPEEWLP